MTRRRGSCERLLMMLSVMPSLKYSAFLSALTLKSGRMAKESMALRERRRLAEASARLELFSGEAALLRESSTACCASSPVRLSSSLTSRREEEEEANLALNSNSCQRDLRSEANSRLV